MTLSCGRAVFRGAILLISLVALGGAHAAFERAASAQARTTAEAPRFEVDPFWPKPLPNHWLLGSTIGVDVDSRDHVWIIHRGAATMDKRTEMTAVGNPPTSEICCAPAPPILEFDAEGTLVGHWGGPGEGYDWPQSNHGITVDFKDNVWIGGNGEKDAHVLKFTRSGKFLLQLGRPGGNAGSNDANNFGRVAKIFVDPKANEAYLADGYLNKRVAVVDAETGKLRRYWGAYGKKPDDTNLGNYDPDAPPPPQFRNPVHCAMLSTDSLLYVCDRANDRIQVFRPDGTFVKEAFVAKRTLGSGSAWDIAFSKDAQQRFVYLADGVNQKVHILDRESLRVLTSFGDGGRQPSQFFGVHSIAVDSKGNIYTTETYEGKRLQKFVYKGVVPVMRDHQGVVWPRTSP
jgi:hypothetical protein